MAAAPTDGTDERLHRVLAIQKKKFLIAINKVDPSDGEVGTFSQADDQLVVDVTMELAKYKHLSGNRPSSKQWTDSEAALQVKDILQRNAVFQLSKYLACSKAICTLFEVKQSNKYITQTIPPIFLYLLTHSRQFGDPTKTIFQIEASDTRCQMPISNFNNVLLRLQFALSKQSSRTAIVTRATQLISELEKEYDETKFQTLNNHITCFTLLLLRRLLRVRTLNKEYQIILYPVVEAYLNTDDEKTKKNIWDTCMKHVEWHDMQLPGLFFKVVELYGIKEAELWDLLSSVNSKNMADSLINLATEYYEKYQLAKKDPSTNYNWFPYCRKFSDQFHKRLSNIENVAICALLSNLLGRKDMSEAPADKNTWAPCRRFNTVMIEWATKIGEELYHKINT